MPTGFLVAGGVPVRDSTSVLFHDDGSTKFAAVWPTVGQHLGRLETCDGHAYITLQSPPPHAPAVMLRSTDGGRNWKPLFLPWENEEIQDAQIACEARQVLMTFTLYSERAIMYSTEEGESWTDLNDETLPPSMAGPSVVAPDGVALSASKMYVVFKNVIYTHSTAQ